MQRVLSGTSVVDFSQLVAGPSAAMLLSDLGADVIKVESPNGDLARQTGAGRWNGSSATFLAYNRNKRSIVLNLKTEPGREVAKRLICASDVTIDAFRPGVMDRLGIGYAACSRINPRLIYAALSGFGSRGPDSDRPGVDLVAQAEGGIMSVTGEAGGPPCKIGFTAVDATTGLALSQAILGALLGRHKTGRGTRIDISLLDVAVYMQSAGLTEYLLSGKGPERGGNKVGHGAPSGLFQTQDGPLMISAYFPDQWKSLCTVLHLDLLEHDERFRTNRDRLANRTALDTLLQEIFLSRPRAAWLALLRPTNIIAAEIKSYSEVAESDQVKLNGMLIRISAEAQDDIRTIGRPYRFSEYAFAEPCMPPAQGAHSRQVLAELGYSQDDIANLISSGAALDHQAD